jgi:6-phosphogluconolactonase
MAQSKRLFVYIGVYTHSASSAHSGGKGIYVYRLDAITGVLTPVSTARNVINPSYLVCDSRRRFLYAVNEVAELDGGLGGAVSAFAIDPETGALIPLNRQSTHGADPCYLSLDVSGKWLLAANYSGGGVTVLSVQADGRLGAATSVVLHQGASVDPERQAGPHAHCTLPDPANRRVLAADLGADKIMLYRFDARSGELAPHDPPWVTVRPGAGPRHLALHPGGRYLYSTNELDSTVTAWAYDAARGTLQEIQTLSTLPHDFAGVNYPAHLQVAPSGKFLYVSNRGHDSLAMFAIDQQGGGLAVIGHVPTQGQWPRHFSIDPTGTWLLVANQRGNSIVTFRIEGETGRLAEQTEPTAIPAPACVQVIELAG